jgi:PilZ domain
VEPLQPKQSVTVKLDDVETPFDCFVRSVAGAITTLGQLGGVAPALQERLTPGSLGFLMWRGLDGGRIALRGVATATPDGAPGLAFVVIEALGPFERRGAPRIPLATTARVLPIGLHEREAEAPIETITADLSLSGGLIEGREGLEIGALLRVDLCFDGLPSPIECEATIVRESHGRLGIRFTSMDERHRARLAIMLAHHRRRMEAA